MIYHEDKVVPEKSFFFFFFWEKWEHDESYQFHTSSTKSKSSTAANRLSASSSDDRWWMDWWITTVCHGHDTDDNLSLMCKKIELWNWHWGGQIIKLRDYVVRFLEWSTASIMQIHRILWELCRRPCVKLKDIERLDRWHLSWRVYYLHNSLSSDMQRFAEASTRHWHYHWLWNIFRQFSNSQGRHWRLTWSEHLTQQSKLRSWN